jgi:hypothetical protein
MHGEIRNVRSTLYTEVRLGYVSTLELTVCSVASQQGEQHSKQHAEVCQSAELLSA